MIPHAPEGLRKWMKRYKLTHNEACIILCLPTKTLTKYLEGVEPIGLQTTRIIMLLDLIMHTSKDRSPKDICYMDTKPPEDPVRQHMAQILHLVTPQ